MKAEIQRSRMIREAILQALSIVDGAGSSFGLTFEQLHLGFSRSRLEVKASELHREMNDLVDDQLICKRWDEELEGWEFRLTSRGRDFKKAGCPWEKIDEYTGGQSPPRG